MILRITEQSVETVVREKQLIQPQTVFDTVPHRILVDICKFVAGKNPTLRVYLDLDFL